ncbi:MAG: hypothetical protein WCK37_04725 [Candidatus Falkowbacteria bacterium]
MVINIILASTTGYYIGLGMVIFAGALFGVMAIFSYGKKNKKSEALKDVSEVSLDAYKVDDLDKNLFHSLKDLKFSIRVSKNSIKAKDVLMFATSMPHNFNQSSINDLMMEVPQLVKIGYSSSHELNIMKSPATNFDQLLDTILKFIFGHLCAESIQVTKEIGDKQKIIIEKSPNGNFMKFIVNFETFRHLELGRKMCKIHGLFVANGTICAERPGNYQIEFTKDKTSSWEELIPEIKETFAEYFTAGVEFQEQ